ncbi:MAG: T9SS type A sorting domain-containing protein [Bacteroidota bacterium]
MPNEPSHRILFFPTSTILFVIISLFQINSFVNPIIADTHIKENIQNPETIENATSVSITFKCNMSFQIIEGKFNPASGTIFLGGSFNEWSNSANQMADEDGDSIYVTTLSDFEVGSIIFFKFIKDGIGWEGTTNRKYTVKEADNIYEAYFEDISSLGTIVTVTFQANMEFEIARGRFDPANSILSVRGSFNGWSNQDVMSQTENNVFIYERSIDIEAWENDVIFYKYAYTTQQGATWENNDERHFTITNDDIVSQIINILRTFNDYEIGPPLIFPTIKFILDMSGAINYLTGVEFENVDNVFIAGSTFPLSWPESGWPVEDSTEIRFLNDEGINGDEIKGDGKWSIEISFPPYTPLVIGYKYGANWGLPSNGGSNDNENFQGSYHRLWVPYNLEYGIIENKFGEMGEHVLTTNAEKTLIESPNSFKLEQNYPNPFNPRTVIKFQVPSVKTRGSVSQQNIVLKVYDILGQEIRTLINGVHTPGNYTVEFNAEGLSSGIYFYTLNASEFKETKKMILLR